MRSMLEIIPRVMAATLLALTIAASAPAQSTDDDEGRAECERARDDEQRECEEGEVETDDEILIRHALGGSAQPAEFRLPLSRIGNDLGFLQAVHHQLSSVAAQSGELDWPAVAQAASEIRRRAGRLKDSLALPPPAGAAGRVAVTAPLDPGHLRAALSALAALIADAVRNPVLGGHLVDATRAATARGDLDGIIELSARIKLSIELTGKAKR